MSCFKLKSNDTEDVVEIKVQNVISERKKRQGMNNVDRRGRCVNWNTYGYARRRL